MDQEGKENADMWRLHARSFDSFLNELYAIMVDPCAEGTMKRDDMMQAIKDAAVRDREASAKETRILEAWIHAYTSLGCDRNSAEIMVRAEITNFQAPPTPSNDILIDALERIVADAGACPHKGDVAKVLIAKQALVIFRKTGATNEHTQD